MMVRMESGLARLNQHSATVDSINLAVSRLAEYAAEKIPAGGKAGNVKHRREIEPLVGYPLEIVPVQENAAADAPAPQPDSRHRARNSSRAVTFESSEPIDTRMVLLTFKFGERRPLSFVV